jgi:hypothetical protein
MVLAPRRWPRINGTWFSASGPQQIHSRYDLGATLARPTLHLPAAALPIALGPRCTVRGLSVRDLSVADSIGSSLQSKPFRHEVVSRLLC